MKRHDGHMAVFEKAQNEFTRGVYFHFTYPITMADTIDPYQRDVTPFNEARERMNSAMLRSSRRRDRPFTHTMRAYHRRYIRIERHHPSSVEVNG